MALTTFEEMRQDARKLISEALDVLRSDWAPDAGPDPVQAEDLHEARSALSRALAALDRAAP